MPRQTDILELSIGYDEDTRTSTWLDSVDSNFETIDNTLGVLLKAISDAGFELSKNVLLEDDWESGFKLLQTTLPKTALFNSVRANKFIYLFENNSVGDGAIFKFNTIDNSIQEVTTAVVPSGFTKFCSETDGTYIYLLAGRENNVSSDKIYRFTVETETIELLQEVLVKKVSYCSSAIVGTNIYLFGGIDENASSIQNDGKRWVIKFNTENHSSSNLGNKFADGYTSSSAIAFDNNIYIFGGLTSNAPQAVIYKYSTVNNILTTVTSLPVALMKTNLILVANNIYIVGGYNYNLKSTAVYSFDVYTNQLTTKDYTLPEGLSNSTLTYANSYGYLFGGEDTNNNTTNKIYRYIP